MRVRMLETRRDTEDGFSLRLLECGKAYELRDYLARSLIAEGRAQQLDTITPKDEGVSDG